MRRRLLANIKEEMNTIIIPYRSTVSSHSTYAGYTDYFDFLTKNNFLMVNTSSSSGSGGIVDYGYPIKVGVYDDCIRLYFFVKNLSSAQYADLYPDGKIITDYGTVQNSLQ